jgi:hypothetical protein
VGAEALDAHGLAADGPSLEGQRSTVAGRLEDIVGYRWLGVEKVREELPTLGLVSRVLEEDRQDGGSH